MIDNSIIAKVLQQTSRLTLPGFGTLLKKPEGEIVFSQFLKTDDMVLTSVVMNSYQVNIEEAKRMVTDFVRDIMDRVTISGQYILPEIGYFEATSSGTIKLKSGFPPQQVITPQRPQVIPQPIVGIPQQQPRQFRQQTPYSPRPQQVIPQRRPQSQQQVGPQPRPQQRTQPVQPQPVQRRNPAMSAPRRQKPKSNKTDYWLIISIIAALIVIVLIVYSLLFTDSVSNYLG